MRAGRIIDITIPVSEGLAAWPGDAPFLMRRNSLIAEGASVNLSEVSLSLHTGTHADAPWHYCDRGAPMDAAPLVVYVGEAAVVDVRGVQIVTPDAVAPDRLRGCSRVLFRTDSWTDHTVFPRDIPTLAPEMAAYLAGMGVRLVGLDVPSVDDLESKDLPVHHALGRCGIHVLESLRLEGVAEGVYELIALPLAIAGADGSPVRAVLRTL